MVICPLLITQYFSLFYWLQAGLRWGGSFMLLGTVLRMLATLPAYEDQLAPRTKFWLVFSANMMVNLGHPVLITMSTKVGKRRRRTTSCQLL